MANCQQTTEAVLIPDASPERSARTVERVAEILLSLLELSDSPLEPKLPWSKPHLRLVK
jgi:hypothetical protein